jgi:FixJ family two-component response regulator
VSETAPLILVIDDDVSVRTALRRLFASVGLGCTAFASASDFLAFSRPDAPSCLVLDVRMPGLSGLDLQREIAASGAPLPIIFLTGHGDIPMSVEAMKRGAVEFLTKPFRQQEMLDAVAHALEVARTARAARARENEVRACYETLSPREQEVMALVVRGLPNKVIAATLGVTEKTIKVHRGHVMEKMQAASLVDLVHLSAALIASPPSASLSAASRDRITAL